MTVIDLLLFYYENMADIRHIQSNEDDDMHCYELSNRDPYEGIIVLENELGFIDPDEVQEGNAVNFYTCFLDKSEESTFQRQCSAEYKEYVIPLEYQDKYNELLEHCNGLR